MGRKVKNGLSYFPMDVDFFNDIKIRKLIKYQSGKAITVYALLLCNIYKDGYYMEWDKELPFVISEATGYDEAYIQEVIRCCINIDLFSKELFDSCGVLTSVGIQSRYEDICRLSKKRAVISEFNLIVTEVMPIITETIGITSEESAQSKEKKSKVNESKVILPTNPIFERIKERSDLPLSECRELFLADENHLNIISCNLFLKDIQETKDLVNEFFKSIELRGERTKSINDAKQHFINWFNKRNNGKQQQEKTNVYVA